ncbi:MAG: adenylosuccinate lyase [Nitrososphaeraceae archaeon]
MAILPIESGRYGSKEMKSLFEEEKKLQYMLDFETAVALAQSDLGLIPKHASQEILSIKKSGKVKLSRIKELEKISDHDIGAFIEALSEQCSQSTKPWVHFGLTSNDIIDTTTSMQIKESLELVESKIMKLTSLLSKNAILFKNQPAVGRTHGQHASIMPFGLKFAVWANEMTKNIDRLNECKKRILICKTLGVIGTGSLMGKYALEIQSKVSTQLGLYPIEAATQIIARERMAELQFIIALIASSLDKIAIEIRNLQRPEIAEVEESFKQGQMGSSAVPVKRNPIKSERISSLAKFLRSFVSVSMENIGLWHERDLSNSANERFTLPLGMILLEELLNTMIKVISGLSINTKRIRENIDLTNGQIYAEFILEFLVKKNMPRIKAYREIQRLAFQSKKNNIYFLDAIKQDELLSKYFTPQELTALFIPENHFASSIDIIHNVDQIVKKYLKD